jgi:GMP reductase
MVANMDTTGTFEVHEKAWKHGIITMLHKHYTADQIEEFYSSSPKESHRYVGISTGITDRDYEKLVELKESDVDPYFITVDVANGYMESLTEYTCKVRKLFPDVILVAGNVVCGQRTTMLLTLGGVDIVKVGIGPGAACLTR